MKVSVNLIIERSFDKFKEQKTYKHLMEEALLLQGNLSEPEVRVQFLIFIAKYVKRTFKQAIRSQAIYGEKFTNMYPPLNEAYKKQKSEKVFGKAKVRYVNAKDKFYINSKWLYDNFTWWIKDETVFIGFRKVTKHPDGPNAQQLLAWLDNGTANMQARPLVSLIVEEVFNDLPRFVDEYLEFVRERIREIKGIGAQQELLSEIDDFKEEIK